MRGVWPQLVLVVILVGVNAAFAGSEVALISLREGQLQRLEEEGERGRLVARIARDPSQFLSTVQIGITLAGFLASAAAAVALAEPLVEPLGRFLGGAAEPVAILTVTALLTFFTLVFGELAPKRIALQRPERWALGAARPLAVVSTAMRPFVWLLSRSTDLVVRLFGGDPRVQREEVTEEEVRDLVASQATFSPQHRTIIAGAFEIADLRLREVLVPRRDVVALRADLPAAAGLRQLVGQTHTRAPVYRDDLDDVLGVVHLPDLVYASGQVGDHARPAVTLPETMEVLDALRRLQEQRQQLALVINEYGGTEGIVTLEDLLEEVVGEIYDEFDPDVATVDRQDDGSFVLPGSFPFHDLPDLGIELPEGTYATVAGFVLERLGRIPTGGEVVEADGWRIEVLAVERRAITRVRIRPLERGQRTGETS
ncbi:MAG TPA: hemolysin family protein [Actinomycetota bacterium]|nr:hemolysin family protein [Actinomycetota bacterium]